MSKSWADEILKFLFELPVNLHLPEGYAVMNPYKGEYYKEIERIVCEFYIKYYSDKTLRTCILGINPGRLGAGSTGLPFTDSIRLKQHCNIDIHGIYTHEPSSVFVYRAIEKYGGAKAFYSKAFITSVCPLGFLQRSKAGNGNWINCNYYDDRELQRTVEPFIVQCIQKQWSMPVQHKKAIVLGTGKNFKYFSNLNKKHGWFQTLEAMEHPRFVMQYKKKEIETYVDKFLSLLPA